MPLKKDTLAGLAFIGFALLFGLTAATTLPAGTATRMGPGYFPILLSGLLGLIGLAILVTGILAGSQTVGSVPRRGLAAILATPIVFGATVAGLGMVASLLLTTMVACLASPTIRPRTLLGVTIGLTLFSVAVFHYALGLNLSLFGPWLPV
ncbi:MAG TPA: tripartite tricarboxylate transporter TctB family protein [Xanthobacteraceae bacterium]|nr:tripartite tricarboxylate transporter TctB family protein [Xanthobacteraceae bacterium]